MENIIDEANRCLNCKVKPCQKACPLGNDIPSFIKQVKENNLEEAFKILTKTTVLGAICGRVCPHFKQCMGSCVRGIKSEPINIGNLETYVFDNALQENYKIETTNKLEGKKVAVIGGGPSGLTCAAFLSINGAKVTIYEKQPKLGGITRYGIPDFRLPREVIDKTVEKILSLGIEAKCNQTLGKDYELADIEKQYDAVYLSFGANVSSKMNIPGEDLDGVYGGNELLETGIHPDYTGKSVAVSGGGNVAMDVARSSVRLGAEKVSIVYRRRKADMTALPEEVEGAEAEGCDVLELMSPVRIEKDENDAAVGLWVQPQMISRIKGGRPSPKTAAKDEVLIPCDLIVVAIGQGIETRYFEEHGVTVKRGTIEALDTSEIKERKGIFAGGDCVTGPATVIRAIAAGKVAAANIDEYLGYHHEITSDVEIPYAGYEDKVPCGRVEVALRDAADRKKDFEPIEYGFSCEEACQESGRCLRCDHFGFGSFRGGREKQW